LIYSDIYSLIKVFRGRKTQKQRSILLGERAESRFSLISAWYGHIFLRSPSI